MHVQLVHVFSSSMSPRVPVFNVGTTSDLERIMFITLTRKADDASVDMDFETLDKNELRQ